MKLGIFADPHYCSADTLCETRRPRLSLGKISEAYGCFIDENVELTLCMGDLTDRCSSHDEAIQNLEVILTEIRKTNLPFLNVPGNHDYLDFTADELEKAGLMTPPYSEVYSGIRLIVLDANYRSDFRRFDEAGVEWTDSNLPPEQIDFLSDILSKSKEPCVVLVHENLDFSVEKHHVIKNADEIRTILENSGKVQLVIQGHYHPGADSTVNGIRYLTIPAMCEGEANHFMILDV